MAGVLSQDWLEWPVIRTCATSIESWQISGEGVVYACRQSDTGEFAYAIALLNLFRGGLDQVLIVQGETEEDFEKRMKQMSQTSGYRIGDVEPELVSRLFWGAYSFACGMGISFTAEDRSTARFFPQPEGELIQWADKLSGEWNLISPRLLELAPSHQAVGDDEQQTPAMIFTTLKCRVSDREKLLAFLRSQSPEIVGGQEERDGSISFDWTGPLQRADETDASSFAAAQRLLAQASLKDDILTVETRTAAWAARFYERITRDIEGMLILEDVQWKSWREILPP